MIIQENQIRLRQMYETEAYEGEGSFRYGCLLKIILGIQHYWCNSNSYILGVDI